MASEVIRDVADNLTNDTNVLNSSTSARTSTIEKSQESQLNEEMELTPSSYTLTSGQSQFSSAVDTWLMGSTTESTGVQGSRVPLIQRSTLTTVSSFGTSGLWYTLAMILPLFSVNNGRPGWRCTPSTLMNTAEPLLAQLARVCERVKNHIRRLAQDHYARDIFATAMDIVLFIYAIGFLVLSMYQASIIG
ncbi:uncharacterized protein ACR2FA_009952 [Aphomia sociella]